MRFQISHAHHVCKELALCSVWCVLTSLSFTSSFPCRMVQFWCFCQAGITSALCMSSWCHKSCLSQVKPKLSMGVVAVALVADSFCMGLLLLHWIHFFPHLSSPKCSAVFVCLWLAFLCYNNSFSSVWEWQSEKQPDLHLLPLVLSCSWENSHAK